MRPSEGRPLDAAQPEHAAHLRLLHSVLDQATDAVLITEAEPCALPGPRILYANAAFTRMTGYTQAEVVGQTPRLLQGPRSDRRVLDRVREALERWERIEVELVNYRKDGSEFWVELSLAPVADQSGWYTHWIAIQRDITRRKHSAEDLDRDRAEVLELSARNVPLPQVLAHFLKIVERQCGGRAALLVGEEPASCYVSQDADPAAPPPQNAGWRQPVLGQAGQLLGHLLVEARQPATTEEQSELQAISQLAALLLERDAAHAALEQSNAALKGALRHAEILAELGDALQQTTTPEQVAARALAQIGPALSALSMLVVQLDGEGIRLPTLWGDTPEVVMTYMTRPGLTLRGAPVLRQVAELKTGLYFDNYLSAPDALPFFPALAGGFEPLCTPDGTLQGFLVIWRPLDTGSWREDERTLMRRAAGTLGLALERAESQTQLAAQSQRLRQNNLDLQRDRTFLHLVLANLSEGVVVCDERGELTLFNDATRVFHGLDASPVPPEEWASHYELFEGDGVTPLSTERVPLYRAWRGELVREAEMVIRSKTGVVRQLLANGQPMFMPDGEALGAVVTLRDVTARRMAELQLSRSNEQLLRSNAELRAANDELEAFTYSASHDLQTPVRHIKSFAELARRALAQSPNPAASLHLERVETAAERMSALISAMLVLSRSTRQALAIEALDLNSLLRRVIADLEPDLIERQVEWRISVLPVVQGDRITVQQALNNLLANAVKFSRGRAPAIIEVWAEERGGEWAVRVRDNGVGFDQNYQSRLFGAFQRLHTDREFEGTGIGLATVRRIILRHGGSVEAQGAEGQGATFSFTLPRTR